VRAVAWATPGVFNTAITDTRRSSPIPRTPGRSWSVTYPQIGNYGGISTTRIGRPWIEGLCARVPGWPATGARGDGGAVPGHQRLPVAARIDTRALVRHLRSRGVMRGVLSAGGGDPGELVEPRAPGPLHGRLDLATRVSTQPVTSGTSRWKRCRRRNRMARRASPGAHVWPAILGQAGNILRRLCMWARASPWFRPAQQRKTSWRFGPTACSCQRPGDPEPLQFQAAQVRKLNRQDAHIRHLSGPADSGLAFGGKRTSSSSAIAARIIRLLNRVTNRLEINLAQSRLRGGTPIPLNQNEIELTHVNLNDQTLEGFRTRSYPVFSGSTIPRPRPVARFALSVRRFMGLIGDGGGTRLAPRVLAPRSWDPRGTPLDAAPATTSTSLMWVRGPSSSARPAEFRLLRRPGLQGVAHGRLPVVLTFQPGHLMTDPDLADRTYVGAER